MSPRYQSIVILTGAGVSAESGINTFRAADGLWENHRVEDVATPEAFVRDPEWVHRFYNARRRHLLSGIQPNGAHQAIAQLSLRLPGQVTVVTQNIDNLHQSVGTEPLYPMHGELLKIRCQRSEQLFECFEDISSRDMCPCCQHSGTLRPHVVWFGEIPLYLTEIDRALNQCDLFIAIGTSGNVYPAAGFFQRAKDHGAHTVELNLEPSATGSYFDEQYYGLATEVVPHFFSRIFSDT